jgi:negative regulator of flagellin synthesis FlgM
MGSMNTTITNNGLPKLPQAGSGTGNGSSTHAAAAPEASAAAPSRTDQVQLTDSARALQEAARLGDASPIDAKRVEQVRQAIADGSYKVDAGKIAERLLAMDQQLGGTDKA